VWIETIKESVRTFMDIVTPHAGVWIETKRQDCKYCWRQVTPHAGVWIETIRAMRALSIDPGHAPRGRVD